MKLRAVAASVAIAMAGAFGGAGMAAMEATAAHAAKPAHRPQTGAITATGQDCLVNGVASTCDVTVSSLQVVDGALAATGTVTPTGTNTTLPFTNAPLAASGACQILDLTLGPLDLDLLGLVVHLDTVHLNITAQSGPGNLLGNLLCAVAGLLDGSGSANALQQIANLLNQILAAL
jgi:hypothetical protein